MFENVGEKIMKYAQIIFWIGVALSALTFVVMFVIAIDDEEGIMFLYGLLAGGLGVLGSWISSLFLYAFGQLVDDVNILNYRINTDLKKSDERLSKIVSAIKENNKDKE